MTEGNTVILTPSYLCLKDIVDPKLCMGSEFGKVYRSRLTYFRNEVGLECSSPAFKYHAPYKNSTKQGQDQYIVAYFSCPIHTRIFKYSL